MLKLFTSQIACLFRRFRRDDSANVAVIFALATLPIIGFVGVAVDYSTVNATKADLQAALDSTALMLAKYAPTHTKAELQSQASKYFNANFNEPFGAGTVSLTAIYSASNSKIVVDGSVLVPTNFMSVLGIDNVTISASSTTTWGSAHLRVALVLDNTGSMARAGKMTALKTATKRLLQQLQSAASKDGDVYVSIIPFSKDVNVGASNYNANWIDWTSWDQNNQTCTGGWGGGNGGNSGWGQGWGKGNSNNSNGNGWNCTVRDHSTWNGCISDRGSSSSPGNAAGYDQKVEVPESGNSETLFPAEQYSSCPVEIMGLSYNWAAMNNLIDSMQPSGNTNQPIGLVWGWQSLVGGGPLTAPPVDSQYNYKKVIILLSDGLNTADRWYNLQTLVDNRMYQKFDGSGTCANIKAAGITIYTIQVNTGGDPTSTLLQNCASSPDKFYLLTTASDISKAFTSIGTQVTKLRVAK